MQTDPMHQILVYADSLSWGIIPNTRNRFGFDQRWPGVMEHELFRMGESVRVIEDCLNGRRTVWEDPFKPGRNGLAGIEQRIGAIICAIRRAPIEPGMPVPEILVVAPPVIQKAKGQAAPKFEGAEQKAVGLTSAIEHVAAEFDCPFFDAGSVTTTSKVDGVHLDAEQHLVLGKALAKKVKSVLSSS